MVLATDGVCRLVDLAHVTAESPNHHWHKLKARMSFVQKHMAPKSLHPPALVGAVGQVSSSFVVYACAPTLCNEPSWIMI